MKIISFSNILSLNITAQSCVKWAKFVMLHKHDFTLPPKTSIKFGNHCFFNTMPSMLLNYDIFGIKAVSRISNRNPHIKADILLYSTKSGKLLSLMDGTWITMMRTGAVAALTMKLLASKNASEISFIGLGATARATLLCYNAIQKGKNLKINLLAYKRTHIEFMKQFRGFGNITFRIFDNIKDLAQNSDVLISCVTAMDSTFANEACYKKGILIIPVHTMGFQNCDLAFDKIFCDDLGHISHFKYFNQYKSVGEMTDILSGKISGRDTDSERILAYNIGISIYDIYFAMKIYKRFAKH